MDEIWDKLYTVFYMEKGSRILVHFSICYGLGGMLYEASTRLIFDISDIIMFRNFQYISVIYLSEYSDRYLRDNSSKICPTSIELLE